MEENKTKNRKLNNKKKITPENKTEVKEVKNNNKKNNTKKPVKVNNTKADQIVELEKIAVEDLNNVETKVSKLPFYKRWYQRIKGWFVK